MDTQTMHQPEADHHGGSLRSYMIGFILSVILTVIPFGMIMAGCDTPLARFVTIVVCAVLQIGVHLVCFLHLSPSASNRWNILVMIFTLVIMGIVIGGSIWIMDSLHLHMMVT